MKDDIVEEIHRIREKLAAKHDFNLRAMLEDAQKRQKDSGHPVVSFSEQARRKNKN